MTLIELMVVMAILTLVAGFLGINIQKAVREQRFRSEVDAVVGQLRLAQNLMLIVGSEAEVRFSTADGGKIGYGVVMASPLSSKGWQAILDKRPPPLEAVHWVELVPRVGKEGALSLEFFSGGTVMSRGILRLSTSEIDNDYNALTRYICLPGFPSPIAAVEEKAAAERCLADSAPEKARALTEDVVEEIELFYGKMREEENDEN